MVTYFKACDYPNVILEAALRKCLDRSRADLLNPTERDTDLAIEDKIFMTTTFRLNDRRLENIVA